MSKTGFLVSCARLSKLRQSGLAQLVALHSWLEENARMWHFIRSNGITEGFYSQQETIARRAYRFRNFENYRQRAQVLCG